MPHWKSIHIERFRRLENLRLDDLGSVNLLVGKNNSGKTSVLEALAIAANPLHPGSWIDVAWKREIKSSRTPLAEVIKWVFPGAGKFTEPGTFKASVRVTADQTDGQQWVMEADAKEFLHYGEDADSSGTSEDGAGIPVLELTMRNWRDNGLGLHMDYEEAAYRFSPGMPTRVEPQPQRPGWPSQFITPVSHRTETDQVTNLSKALDQQRRGEIVELLKTFMPHVDSVEIVSLDPRNPRVRIQGNGHGSQPLSVQGDGLRRALVLATSVSFAGGGFLLIDEIETALHPDVLENVMRFLVNACRERNIQLFVTTHSLEAVDAILAGMDGKTDDLTVFRLPPQGSGLPLKRFAGQTVFDSRHEGGLDLR
jgi:hypothetical protein